MPTITQAKFDSDMRSNLSFRVYTDGDKPRDITSEWFEANNIGSLKFKCKSWGKVARAGVAISEKQMVPVIAKEFGLKPEDFTVRFSPKAGCSCGCSPGYVGKLLAYHPKLSRNSVYMKGFELSSEDLAAYNAVCEKQKTKLTQEIYNFDHAAALEAAAKAQRQLDADAAAHEASIALSLQSASL